jgi:hypothetical protein
VQAFRREFENIPVEMIGLVYDDPDDVRPSDHDERPALNWSSMSTMGE